jgi:DNA-binding CsgD family transcriptional regulator
VLDGQYARHARNLGCCGGVERPTVCLVTRPVPSAAREILALSQHGIDLADLRAAIRTPLRRLIGAGPVFIASADPDTWLFTGAVSSDIPAAATPLFLRNEFAEDDVVKFRHLAAAKKPIGTLFDTTGGRPATSARWRDVLEPLGWGDELRVALRVGGRTWGFLCLHRERDERPFTAEDAARLAPVLPGLAAAFRRTSLATGTVNRPTPDGPGVVLLDEAGGLVSSTGSAAAWLDALGSAGDGGLPLPILGLAERLRTEGAAPALRIRSNSGSWVALHGGLLDGPGPARVAVVLEPVSPGLALPMHIEALGLTPREAEVTAAVLRGESTSGIAALLYISEYTVQAHLKAVFSKSGVHSRRELVGRLLGAG